MGDFYFSPLENNTYKKKILTIDKGIAVESISKPRNSVEIDLEDMKKMSDNEMGKINSIKYSYDDIIDFIDHSKSRQANIDVLQRFISVYNEETSYFNNDLLMLEDVKDRLKYWKRYDRKISGIGEGLWHGMMGIPLSPFFGLPPYNTNNTGWMFYKVGILLGGLLFPVLILCSSPYFLWMYFLILKIHSYQDKEEVEFNLVFAVILISLLFINIIYLF